MAERPVSQDDPVVGKSLAPHYVIATVVLMATLFWALWDENFGQRPWKAFQKEWKTRYSAFLGGANSTSSQASSKVASQTSVVPALITLLTTARPA